MTSAFALSDGGLFCFEVVSVFGVCVFRCVGLLGTFVSSVEAHNCAVGVFFLTQLVAKAL